MIRRPPRSTLFPTRRSSDLETGDDDDGRPCDISLHGAAARLRERRPLDTAPRRRRRRTDAGGAARGVARARGRSEEHTSELQSRQYLVCRLLLEKKQFKLIE